MNFKHFQGTPRPGPISKLTHLSFLLTLHFFLVEGLCIDDDEEFSESDYEDDEDNEDNSENGTSETDHDEL